LSRAPKPVSPFKAFYLSAFSTLRKWTTTSKKSVSLATARHYLAALLLPHFPQHMQPFHAFLDDLLASSNAGTEQGSSAPPRALPPQRAMSLATAALEGSGPRLSFDQWASVLEWCATVHPHTLSGYEGPEIGSWPVLIDDFVEWLCARAPAVREATTRALQTANHFEEMGRCATERQPRQQQQQMSSASTPPSASSSSALQHQQQQPHSRPSHIAATLVPPRSLLGARDARVLPLDADCSPGAESEQQRTERAGADWHPHAQQRPTNGAEQAQRSANGVEHAQQMHQQQMQHDSLSASPSRTSFAYLARQPQATAMQSSPEALVPRSPFDQPVHNQHQQHAQQEQADSEMVSSERGL